ncbi:MAG: hypothetical protein KC594_07365, partial [Nitrospira sp.]|nr:hypothetical protein [Nitrospira sp.]
TASLVVAAPEAGSVVGWGWVSAFSVRLLVLVFAPHHACGWAFGGESKFLFSELFRFSFSLPRSTFKFHTIIEGVPLPSYSEV